MGPKSRKTFKIVFGALTVYICAMIHINYLNVKTSERFQRYCGKPLTEDCKDSLQSQVFEMPSMLYFDIFIVVWVTLTIMLMWVQINELITHIKQRHRIYKSKRKKAMERRSR